MENKLFLVKCKDSYKYVFFNPDDAFFGFRIYVFRLKRCINKKFTLKFLKNLSKGYFSSFNFRDSEDFDKQIELLMNRDPNLKWLLNIEDCISIEEIEIVKSGILELQIKKKVEELQKLVDTVLEVIDPAT